MDVKRREVRKFGKAFINGLRQLVKKHPPEKSPCASCAFAPHTDKWDGFLSTMNELVKAVMNEKPFYCHRNMDKSGDEYHPDWDNMIPCENYEAIRERPEVKEILIKAARKVSL